MAPTNAWPVLHNLRRCNHNAYVRNTTLTSCVTLTRTYNGVLCLAFFVLFAQHKDNGCVLVDLHHNGSTAQSQTGKERSVFVLCK
jgi:hypothetical protein